MAANGTHLCRTGESSTTLYPRLVADKPVGVSGTYSRCMPDALHVTLRFPARPDFLRLARLAATDVGSRAGFDIDEIEDLRIAVSELCAIVGGGESEMDLHFTLEDGMVEVHATGEGPTGPAEEEEFVRALIDAVVDELDIVGSDGARTIRVVKRRRVDSARESGS